MVDAEEVGRGRKGLTQCPPLFPLLFSLNAKEGSELLRSSRARSGLL